MAQWLSGSVAERFPNQLKFFSIFKNFKFACKFEYFILSQLQLTMDSVKIVQCLWANKYFKI